MSAVGDNETMESFFRAALAARQETFLAYYPRKLKVSIAALLLLPIVSLLIFSMLSASEVSQKPDGFQSDAAALEGLFSESNVPSATNTSEQTPALLPGSRTWKTHSDPLNDAERQAIEHNDTVNASAHMALAPDMGLVEKTANGSLPRIGEDGRKPWQVYARPYDQADPRPRIAIVMIDMGLSKIATDAALRQLQPNVTMAFDAQASNIADWLDRARSDGHETLLSLPMEPTDYPRSDPGPGTLLTSLPNEDNVQRLLGALKEGSGYIGVTTVSGSRFTADPGKLEPVLHVLHDRGLLVLDARAGLQSVWGDLAAQARVPVASVSRTIDATATPQAIDATLSEIEKTARIQGRIVVTATPLPVTLNRLDVWMKKLPERGISLAPLSAVVE